MNHAKYVFVTGGVVSGLGKGITAASLGRLLTNRGLKVTIQKFDVYLNVDPGNMSPYRHGEIFVTDDGAETDIDVGHYERFLGKHFTVANNSTTGKIYQNVISRERSGEFNGRDIQVIPHITDEIITQMKAVADGNDVVIIELGGTIGDIESMAHVEAIRQFRKKLGPQGSVLLHLTLIPYLEASGEIKTKPTQNSVRDLSRLGVTADMIVCRTSAHVKLDAETKEKLVMYCNLDSVEDVIHAKDARSIYEVPLLLKEQNMDDIVLKKLGLKAPKGDMREWEKMVDGLTNGGTPKTIAVVGKYVEVPDAYLSVSEAIRAAALATHVKPTIKFIHAEDVEKHGAKKMLQGADAIIVPSGFGKRGLEGKMLTAQYARENKTPFLALGGLGMSSTVLEFAKNVAKIKDEKELFKKGDVMRLGLYKCALTPGSKAHAQYGKAEIAERHRHKYEFQNEFKKQLEDAGLVFSGINKENDLVEIVEIVELKDHPYFVAAHFNAEFISKPYKPHPLFVGLMK